MKASISDLHNGTTQLRVGPVDLAFAATLSQVAHGLPIKHFEESLVNERPYIFIIATELVNNEIIEWLAVAGIDTYGEAN